MSAIIFGAGGQDGYYLTRHLQNFKIPVTGISRSKDFINIAISDYAKVAEIIKKQTPQYIFHLAAVSTTKHSAWKENYAAIVDGTINILEAVKEFSPTTKVFITGSGLQFRNNGMPIKESDNFEASSIYAAARISSVYTARYYRSLGFKVYVGYLFNHDSPIRDNSHINKTIVETVKRIANGSNEKLLIGDLSVKKEFGYADDIVKGIWTLVNQENDFEAVIGTGKAYSLEDWVNLCFNIEGLNWKNHVELLYSFVPEYKILVSQPATMNHLGWKHTTSIEQLAELMMK